MSAAPSSDDRVHVACPLCGGNQPRPFGEERGLQFKDCRLCGMMNVTPRLSHEALLNLYNRDYYRTGRWSEVIEERNQKASGTKTTAPVAQLWPNRYATVWPALYRALGKVASFRALDVGAGGSSWPEWVLRQGAESWAFDIAATPALDAAPKAGETPQVRWVTAPDISVAGLPEAHFDLVTLWDVIEHLERPADMLREVRRVLRPDGVLFVQTPNAWWTRRKYQVASMLPARWIAPYVRNYGLLLPEQHLQYYSARTLRQQLEQAGFHSRDEVLVDWREPAGRLDGLIYALVYAQARAVGFLTARRSNTNIGLSVIARRTA